MNKKTFGLLIPFFVLTLLLGVGYVFAEETPVIAPISIKEVSPTGTPPTVAPQTKEKKTLREIYQERIRSFRTTDGEERNDIEKKVREQVPERSLDRPDRLQPPQDTQKIRENDTEKRKEIKEEALKAREERKSKLEADRKERVKQQTDRISENFERILKRIESVEGKVTERIITIEERGIDLTEAKTLLINVPIKIEEARQGITDMKNALQTALDSETPIESFRQAKEFVTIAKNKVKEAHQSLIKVVNAIKASVKLVQ